MKLIVACDIDGNIGKKGRMPWGLSIREDLELFKELTMGHDVIMGRKTFDSINQVPLSGRRNIVITSDNSKESLDKDLIYVHSFEEALEVAREDAFFIGGESIYKYVIQNDLVDTLYVTIINEQYTSCDAQFPLEHVVMKYTLTECEQGKTFNIKFCKFELT